MQIAIAADHGGFPLKQAVADALRRAGHAVEDLGTHSTAPCDYPDIAFSVADAVASGRAARGVVLCGSGVGACVAANKVAGVRASVCHDTYSAAQGVEHDDMNVLCLGARVVGEAVATQLALAFAGAEFTGEERHVRRLNKVLARERRCAQ